MFNNTPIINSTPTGFATNNFHNPVGNFDSYGNFTNTFDQYSTSKVDAFGYLRDNVTNNIVGEVRGVLPRTDLYTHKPYDYNNSFELPGMKSSKSYDFKNIFELPAYRPINLYDI